MPWQGSCWYPFDVESILIAAPAAPGVYALRTQWTWVYIGETENLEDGPLEHVDGHNLCIARVPPTLFGYEAVPGEARKGRQRELIGEFRPTCNQWGA